MLYDVIKIVCTDRLSFLCRVWPRLDKVGNGYIQFDGTVLAADVEHHYKLLDGFTDTLSIPVHNIQKVTCSAVESVSVTVVTNWSEFVSCSKNSAEVLQCQIRNLLTGLVISASHAVLCSRTPLGKLFCWNRIIFHTVVIKNGCSCGFVTHSSEIDVTEIISKERFEQRTQKVTMLGGLDNEICMLHSIVRQCQKRDLPDSLHKRVSISCRTIIQLCKCVDVLIHRFCKIVVLSFLKKYLLIC